MRRWVDERMTTIDHLVALVALVALPSDSFAGCAGCASCAATRTQPSALFLTSTARPCPRSPLSPPPRPASCRHCCPPPTLHPSPCRHSSCCRHQHPPPSPPRHRCRPSSPPCCWYWGWSGSQRTNRLTRVGSRDAYASKKQDHQR